jgi:preprotein translocase subunit SecG
MAWLQVVQIILAIMLIVSVLMQNRGAGLGEVFGGSGGVYLTKRGLEKKLFIATIIIATLFLLSSLAVVLFK